MRKQSSMKPISPAQKRMRRNRLAKMKKFLGGVRKQIDKRKNMKKFQGGNKDDKGKSKMTSEEARKRQIRKDLKRIENERNEILHYKQYLEKLDKMQKESFRRNEQLMKETEKYKQPAVPHRSGKVYDAKELDKVIDEFHFVDAYTPKELDELYDDFVMVGSAIKRNLKGYGRKELEIVDDYTKRMECLVGGIKEQEIKEILQTKDIEEARKEIIDKLLEEGKTLDEAYEVNQYMDVIDDIQKLEKKLIKVFAEDVPKYEVIREPEYVSKAKEILEKEVELKKKIGELKERQTKINKEYEKAIKGRTSEEEINYKTENIDDLINLLGKLAERDKEKDLKKIDEEHKKQIKRIRKKEEMPKGKEFHDVPKAKKEKYIKTLIKDLKDSKRFIEDDELEIVLDEIRHNDDIKYAILEDVIRVPDNYKLDRKHYEEMHDKERYEEDKEIVEAYMKSKERQDKYIKHRDEDRKLKTDIEKELKQQGKLYKKGKEYYPKEITAIKSDRPMINTMNQMVRSNPKYQKAMRKGYKLFPNMNIAWSPQVVQDQIDFTGKPLKKGKILLKTKDKLEEPTKLSKQKEIQSKVTKAIKAQVETMQNNAPGFQPNQPMKRHDKEISFSPPKIATKYEHAVAAKVKHPHHGLMDKKDQKLYAKVISNINKLTSMINVLKKKKQTDRSKKQISELAKLLRYYKKVLDEIEKKYH